MSNLETPSNIPPRDSDDWRPWKEDLPSAPPEFRKIRRIPYATGGKLLPKAESVIYETENDDRGHRIKIGSQTLSLPPSAEVDVQVRKDGSGAVTVVIPAESVRVIPAGKRVVKSRKRDRENQEPTGAETKTDAD